MYFKKMLAKILGDKTCSLEYNTCYRVNEQRYLNIARNEQFNPSSEKVYYVIFLNHLNAHKISSNIHRKLKKFRLT